MNILKKIVAYKRKEVEQRKSIVPFEQLQDASGFARSCISLSKALDAKDFGIIAEYKRQSPSKGIINDRAEISETTKGYVNSGATGLSVLTDSEFFGGSTDDLREARINDCPILRKDFIIDPYQITEAKSIGADVILLIGAILKPEETKAFTAIAHDLGLEVLLEVHTEQELQDHFFDNIDMVGVNNRNLKTFEVDIQNSIKIAGQIPKNTVKVAESGISSGEAIVELKSHSFKGFLIGEYFMAQDDPPQACRELIHRVQVLEQSIHQQ